MMKSFIRKNSDSPIGFEPMNSHYQLDRLITDQHRTLGELGVRYSSNIHPAYTEKKNVLCHVTQQGVIRSSVVRVTLTGVSANHSTRFNHTYHSISATKPLVLAQRKCSLLSLLTSTT